MQTNPGEKKCSYNTMAANGTSINGNKEIYATSKNNLASPYAVNISRMHSAPINHKVRSNIINTISRIDKVLSVVSKEANELEKCTYGSGGSGVDDFENFQHKKLEDSIETSLKDNNLFNEEKCSKYNLGKPCNLVSQGSQTSNQWRQPCGLVEFVPNLTSFYINCFHCSTSFMLTDTVKFIRHLRLFHPSKFRDVGPITGAIANPTKTSKDIEEINCELEEHPMVTESSTVNAKNNDGFSPGGGNEDFIHIINIDDITNGLPEDNNNLSYNKENDKKQTQYNNNNNNNDEVILTRFEYDDDDEDLEQPCKEVDDNPEEPIIPKPTTEIFTKELCIDIDATAPSIVKCFLNLLKSWPALYLERNRGKSLYTFQANALVREFKRQTNCDLSIENLEKSLLFLRLWYLSMTPEKFYRADRMKSEYYLAMQQIDKLSKCMTVHCYDCPDIFFTEETELKLHKFRKHKIGNLQYKCKYCYQYFETVNEQRNHHFSRHHSTNLGYFCNSCCQTFVDEELLLKHTFDSHSIKYYKCFCNDVFISIDVLKKHQLQQHNVLSKVVLDEQRSGGNTQNPAMVNTNKRAALNILKQQLSGGGGSSKRKPKITEYETTNDSKIPKMINNNNISKEIKIEEDQE